jgi:ankyrin repeat protein
LNLTDGQDEKSDTPIYDKFRSLVVTWDTSELKQALAENPSLIEAQDEQGMTLLHHAADIGRSLGHSSAREVLNVLFASPGINWNIKNNSGNTPVHVAATLCQDRTTYELIFPEFVKTASEHGFDFSTLNNQGQSVLHLATKISYERWPIGRQNNVRNMLNNAPNPGLDVLSSSGSTALYYAINGHLFSEANTLLEAGANPLLFGSPDRSPLGMIAEQRQNYTDALTQPEYANRHDLINQYIQKLDALEQKIGLKVQEAQADSFVEIRKNARMLAQGRRTDSCFNGTGSLFSRLPEDVLMHIAADTQTTSTSWQSRKEAEDIAAAHLCKP